MRLAKTATTSSCIEGTRTNIRYQKPVITIIELATSTGVQINTAAALITEFMRLSILRELTGQTRNRQFMFGEYVHLFVRGSRKMPKQHNIQPCG